MIEKIIRAIGKIGFLLFLYVILVIEGSILFVYYVPYYERSSGLFLAPLFVIIPTAIVLIISFCTVYILKQLLHLKHEYLFTLIIGSLLEIVAARPEIFKWLLLSHILLK